MRLNNTINTPTNFNSRNIDIRKADDIVRHANKTINAFHPSFAMENWLVLKPNGFTNKNRKAFYSKFEKLIFEMRKSYPFLLSDNKDDCIKLFDAVKKNKLANCFESTYLTLGALFSNGYKNGMKAGLEMEVGAYDKISGKCVVKRIIPIDHAVALSTMDNSKRRKIDRAIVLDGWLNKAMDVSEAKQEYERFVSQRQLMLTIQDLEEELKFKHSISTADKSSEFNISNFEFRKSIEFVENQRFTPEEAKIFGQEVLKRYPDMKLNELA